VSNYVIAYDGDCGPCRRFKSIVDILDRYHRIDFVSLAKADELGLLNRLPQSLKYSSFHLISSTGEILSGAEALIRLIEVFPLGSDISRLIILLPGFKRITKLVYSCFSRLHESNSCELQHD